MNLATQIISEVEKALLGKDETVGLSVVCLLAEGHLLIDDTPGVGKTTLALALAQSIGGEFQRIQFTSDLLPTDLIGVSVYNQKQNIFDFKKGPLFHHMILADEINRASPKTQSALLEAMQEGQISMDNVTHSLPRPFFVIATQNPYEHHGTFPLPESQLDRFMMRLNVGYPEQDVETAILRGDSTERRTTKVKAVTTPQAIRESVEEIRKIRVDKSLDQFMVQIAHGTRQSPLVELGLSPRGTLAIRRASQAFAFSKDRDYVIPDDVKAIAVPVMAHRVRLKGNYNGSTPQTTESLLSDIVNKIPIPT